MISGRSLIIQWMLQAGTQKGHILIHYKQYKFELSIGHKKDVQKYQDNHIDFMLMCNA